MRHVGGALALVALPTLVGCGSVGPAPSAVSVSFNEAIARHDGAGACRLLAPETASELAQSAGAPCREAVLEEDLHDAGAVQGTSSFGTMTQVRLSHDVYFFAEFGRRWRVLAAGCTPGGGDAPYQCHIKGG